MKSLNSKTTSKYDHQKTREECDTYTDGVFAVLALVNEARWDPVGRKIRDGVSFGFGRRMTTSAANRRSPQNDVTPDCVVQTDAQYGFLAETKLSLPKNEDRWDKGIEQLEKYDDDLVGWWTANELIMMHDIIALVPLVRAVRFADRVQEGRKGGLYSFQRKLSVVGFFKTSQVKDFLTIKKESGEISDRRLDQRLRESRAIPIDILLFKYKDRKFVDHMPPLPYLLQIIWDDLFTRYASDAILDESKDWIALAVSLVKVTDDLQEYFGFKSSGPRSPEIPRVAWVKRALDALVEFKVAEKRDNGEYLIRYKRTRTDTLKKFGQLCFKMELKSRKPNSVETPFLPGLG